MTATTKSQRIFGIDAIVPFSCLGLSFVSCFSSYASVLSYGLFLSVTFNSIYVLYTIACRSRADLNQSFNLEPASIRSQKETTTSSSLERLPFSFFRELYALQMIMTIPSVFLMARFSSAPASVFFWSQNLLIPIVTSLLLAIATDDDREANLLKRMQPYAICVALPALIALSIGFGLIQMIPSVLLSEGALWLMCSTLSFSLISFSVLGLLDQEPTPWAQIGGFALSSVLCLSWLGVGHHFPSALNSTLMYASVIGYALYGIYEACRSEQGQGITEKASDGPMEAILL